VVVVAVELNPHVWHLDLSSTCSALRVVVVVVVVVQQHVIQHPRYLYTIDRPINHFGVAVVVGVFATTALVVGYHTI
jgi:hypothetical protein